jgi:hypothetical protein
MAEVHETKFGTIIAHDDGSASVDTDTVSAEVDGEGHIRLSLKRDIARIALENVADIVSHSIERSDNSCAHFLEFRNGGTMRFAYRSDGKILEFSATKAAVSIDREGVVTISLAEEE